MYKLIKLNITIKPNINIEYNGYFQDEYELVQFYLSTLVKNGQIMSNYSIIKSNKKYIVYCTISDITTLSEKYNNEYTNMALKYLNIFFEIIGDNLYFYEDCSYSNSSWYLLYSDYESSNDESPLKCGDCGNDIPLYKTPYLFGEKEHLTLLNYQKLYACVDTIWMESLSDRYSKNQLTNTGSALVKQGLKIRQELEAKLNKPVYLFVRKPIGGLFDFKNNNFEIDVCPICKEKLDPSLNQDLCGKMCHHCRIAFNNPYGKISKND